MQIVQEVIVDKIDRVYPKGIIGLFRISRVNINIDV